MMPRGLMARRLTLDQFIEVRILAGQPDSGFKCYHSATPEIDFIITYCCIPLATGQSAILGAFTGVYGDRSNDIDRAGVD